MNCVQEGVLYIRQKEDAVTFYGDKFSNGDKVLSVGTQVTDAMSGIPDGFFETLEILLLVSRKFKLNLRCKCEQLFYSHYWPLMKWVVFFESMVKNWFNSQIKISDQESFSKSLIYTEFASFLIIKYKSKISHLFWYLIKFTS